MFVCVYTDLTGNNYFFGSSILFCSHISVNEVLLNEGLPLRLWVPNVPYHHTRANVNWGPFFFSFVTLAFAFRHIFNHNWRSLFLLNVIIIFFLFSSGGGGGKSYQSHCDMAHQVASTSGKIELKTRYFLQNIAFPSQSRRSITNAPPVLN